MWAYESVFYQIYPLGFCGAPSVNDGRYVSRILKVKDWIPHILALGADTVYFNPLFESDTHGYNTRDYRKVDTRLGTNEDFGTVCRALHEAGLRVVLDGVFNHAGRGFFAFQDVLARREASPYRDWFYINFGGNSPYNDGLWYEGWEGNFDLVKLNLKNPAVVDYLLESVRDWITWWDIDGLRLDVAYCLDLDFMRKLRAFCDGLKNDFFLVGEMLHGDYNRLLGDGLLHSVTNYECYKGLWSALNSRNLFEIIHSLIRQYGSDPWCLYRGKHLLSFVDNHDVTRAASILTNPVHLPLLYALCFTMPGIPCVYYGSEWGATGNKADGDEALRFCPEEPVENDLFHWIRTLAGIRKMSPALNYGSFRSVFLTNLQCVFERRTDDERILVGCNIDGAPFEGRFDAGCRCGVNLLDGSVQSFEGRVALAPYSVSIWRCRE